MSQSLPDANASTPRLPPRRSAETHPRSDRRAECQPADRLGAACRLYRRAEQQLLLFQQYRDDRHDRGDCRHSLGRADGGDAARWAGYLRQLPGRADFGRLGHGVHGHAERVRGNRGGLGAGLGHRSAQRRDHHLWPGQRRDRHLGDLGRVPRPRQPDLQRPRPRLYRRRPRVHLFSARERSSEFRC